jgi:hypothetical protein
MCVCVLERNSGHFQLGIRFWLTGNFLTGWKAGLASLQPLMNKARCMCCSL